MAEKSAKNKRRKADQESVLGSLPSTRPARIGRARPASDEGGGTATATKEPARATRSSRGSKSSPRGAKSSPRGAKSSPRGAKSSARATKARPAAPEREPAAPRRADRATPPRGLEIVTTGAQAAGELARIGFTVGGQVLRRAARRVPRP